MRFKLIFSTVCGILFLSHAAIAQETTQVADNATQIRQLVLNSCQKDENFCNCLADNMSSTLSTDKELSIMNALASDSQEPPANVTDDDLSQFAEKLLSAATACGQVQ